MHMHMRGLWTWGACHNSQTPLQGFIFPRVARFQLGSHDMVCYLLMCIVTKGKGKSINCPSNIWCWWYLPSGLPATSILQAPAALLPTSITSLLFFLVCSEESQECQRDCLFPSDSLCIFILPRFYT